MIENFVIQSRWNSHIINYVAGACFTCLLFHAFFFSVLWYSECCFHIGVRPYFGNVKNVTEVLRYIWIAYAYGVRPLYGKCNKLICKAHCYRVLQTFYGQLFASIETNSVLVTNDLLPMRFAFRDNYILSKTKKENILWL